MNSYYRVNTIRICIKEICKGKYVEDTFKFYLVHDDSTNHNNTETTTFAQHLKAIEPLRPASHHKYEKKIQLAVQILRFT